MNTIWKNKLQEYCQKQKVHLPSYRIKKQSGPPHSLRFQVEVEVNGQWYVGNDLCESKKDAEQSAARKACEILFDENMSSTFIPPSREITTIERSEMPIEPPPPSYEEVVNSEPKYHLPDQYADIEDFIRTKVGECGGRIRKIFPPDAHGRYKFEITGTYRYCERIGRHHKSNQIYFIVDAIKRTYIQKCHDTDCYNFQSTVKYMDNDQRVLSNTQQNNSVKKCSLCQKRTNYRVCCQRCGRLFCNNCVSECDLCHDEIHCEHCLELCFDCHDS